MQGKPLWSSLPSRPSRGHFSNVHCLPKARRQRRPTKAFPGILRVLRATIWRRLSNRAITLQRGLFQQPNPVSLRHDPRRALDELLQKVWAGRRINPAEALRLYHISLRNLRACRPAASTRQGRAYNGPRQRNVTYTLTATSTTPTSAMSIAVLARFTGLKRTPMPT